MPNKTKITPETVDHTSVGTPSRAVVDRKSSVNTAIDIIKLAMITRGLLIVGALPVWAVVLPPITTGISGNMHGASTVSTPAKKKI